MYFGYFSAMGAFMPYINLHYQRLGLSGAQIGFLAALPVIVISITSLVWSGLADTFRIHHWILRGALLAVPLSVLLLMQGTQFETLIFLIALYALFITPVLPLLDSAALEVAAEQKRSFGALRVWGTIGWSASTWLVGLLIQRQGIQWMFYSYAALMGLTFLVSLFQPARRQMLRAPVHHGLRQLLLRWDFTIFLVSTFLVAMTAQAVMAFYSLYMDGIGASEGLIGLAWMLAAVSEIPVMWLSGAVLRRVPARWVLAFSFAVFAVRWLLLSFATQPTFALLTQLLNGLSFGASFVAGITYVNQRTPEGMGATAQAVYSTVAVGLASIAGSLVGGYLFDRLAYATFFRVLSAVAALGLVLFTFSRQKPPVPQHDAPS